MKLTNNMINEILNKEKEDPLLKEVVEKNSYAASFLSKLQMQSYVSLFETDDIKDKPSVLELTQYKLDELRIYSKEQKNKILEEIKKQKVLDSNNNSKTIDDNIVETIQLDSKVDAETNTKFNTIQPSFILALRDIKFTS